MPSIHPAHHVQSWFPVDADTWASQMEASLSIGDWVTNVAYFSVVSICAPIWEEVRHHQSHRSTEQRHVCQGWRVYARVA